MCKKVVFIILIGVSLKAELSLRGDIFAAVESQRVEKDSPVNTNNTVLELAENRQVIELRPDLSYPLSDNHSVTFRSRHILFFEQINYFEAQAFEERTDSDNDITDFFISSVWGDALSTTVGAQNYQWGPAEIFSPTNPYYHFNNSQRSFFYKEKGQVLLRAGYDISLGARNLNLTAIFEPTDNREPHWVADQEFTEKSVLKGEVQFENPANSVALLVGKIDQEKTFVGHYFTWAPNETWSLYADTQHRQGDYHYSPIENGLGGYDLEILDPAQQEIKTFSVVGVRWEGRVDFRQEFIWNESGWSQDEWKQALQAATTLNANILMNSRRFAKPGLEFRSKSYAYTSLRIPELGDSKEMSIAIRVLFSLTQEASATQLNWEYNANDRTVLSAETIFFGGKKNTEFTLLGESQMTAGFKWSF